MFHRLAILLLLSGSGALVSCGPGAQGTGTPAELRRAFEAAPSIEVQLGVAPANGSLSDSLLRATAHLEARIHRPVSLGEVDRAEAARVPRIVVGCPSSPEIGRLLEALGAEVNGDSFVLGSLALERDASLFHLCAEDPDRPGLPLQLLVASSSAALQEAVEDLSVTTRLGVTLIERRSPQRFLKWSEVFAEERQQEAFPQFSAAVGAQGLVLRHLADVPESRAQSYLGRASAALERVAAWTEQRPSESLELLAVGQGERMRQLVGESDQSVHDGIRGRRVVLLAAGIPDDFGAIAARWAARESLGPAAQAWCLDGLAIDAADHWWGRPLEEWGGHLLAAELVPPVSVIIGTDSVDLLSQHILAPARALLFRYLREQGDARALRELWSGEQQLEASDDLQASFVAWLRVNTSAPLVDVELPRRIPAEEILRGVAFDSNMRGGGGYDSRGFFAAAKAARSLDQGAASITSFFTEEPGPRGAFGGRLPLGRECVEGDISLAQALDQARRAGLGRTLLQPHLLLSDSAGHSAWLRRTSLEHWTEFFDEYEPMLVHYGLLAELCGVDILCIGTNLSTPSSNAGLPEEVREFFDRRWRECIAMLRRAYGGALTYGAAWPGEANNWRFWRELDYVGLSLFPRFAEVNEVPPQNSALRGRWTTILKGVEELSKRVERPALIVELGVRSTQQSVTETRVGPGALDLAEQERAYSALASALELQRERGFEVSGLFLWKWTTESRGGGQGDRGFTPQNKAAARLLPSLAGSGDGE